MLGHLILNYEHKIAFCRIQKVASSEWGKFFNRLTGDPEFHRESVVSDALVFISPIVAHPFTSNLHISASVLIGCLSVVSRPLHHSQKRAKKQLGREECNSGEIQPFGG